MDAAPNAVTSDNGTIAPLYPGATTTSNDSVVHVGDEPLSAANGENDDCINGGKRPALAGQWRTPPTMLFFPGMSAEQQQQLENEQKQQQEQQLPVAPAYQQNTTQTATQQIQHSTAPPPLSQPQHLTLNSSSSHPNLSSNASLTAVGSQNLIPLAGATSSQSNSATVDSSPSSTQTVAAAASAVFPMVTSIPHSTEDYAKALQEAYRRGAEAAAMAAAAQVNYGASNMNSTIVTDHKPPPLSNMSNHSHSHYSVASLVSTVSCPDFTARSQPTRNSPLGFPTTTTTTTYMPAPNQQHQHLQAVSTAGGGTIGSLSDAPMTVIPTQVHTTNNTAYHHFQPVQTDSASVASLMPPPAPVSSSVPDPMQYQQTSGIMCVQPTSYNQQGGISVGQQNPVTSQSQQAIDTLHQPSQQPIQHYQHQTQRSVSMPDMSSYAVQQEEEKRQKRLARNRASARLRRLRKKNLVDAYEIEVGILEKTLQMLKDHEWGGDANKKDGNNESRASALAAALSMDRGQQLLTLEGRKQAANDILSQQLLFLDQLESLLEEQFILHEVARMQLQQSDANNNTVLHDDNFQDLRQMLNLTDEQARDLQHSAKNWEVEWNALQTVKESLLAMKDNNWLWNDGCIETADQFLRILHKNQISKFLLWCDHNVEAIEELDCVNARPVDSPTAPGPVFSFGVDSHPGEFLDE